MSVWEPGDRALCVNVGPLLNEWGETFSTPQLSIGKIYRVKAVTHNGCGLIVFEAKPRVRGNSFDEARFRKLWPHAPDEQDEITIRLMKGEKVEMS